MADKPFMTTFYCESEELKNEIKSQMKRHGLSWAKFLNSAAKREVERLKNIKPIDEQ